MLNGVWSFLLLLINRFRSGLGAIVTTVAAAVTTAIATAGVIALTTLVRCVR